MDHTPCSGLDPLIHGDGNQIILMHIQPHITIRLWHTDSLKQAGELHQQKPGMFVFGCLLQTQIRASLPREFPVEQSEQAAKHNRELVVITSQSAHGEPDTASPEHASLFISTRTAYPKTRPAATRKRPCGCWQHANTIVSKCNPNVPCDWFVRFPCQRIHAFPQEKQADRLPRSYCNSGNLYKPVGFAPTVCDSSPRFGLRAQTPRFGEFGGT